MERRTAPRLSGSCPHCLRQVRDLADHLRDPGDAPPRPEACPVLATKRQSYCFSAEPSWGKRGW